MEDLLKELALQKQMQEEADLSPIEEVLSGSQEDQIMSEQIQSEPIGQDQAQDIYNASVNDEVQSDYMKTKDEQLNDAMPEVAARDIATKKDEADEVAVIETEKEMSAQEKLVQELQSLRKEQSGAVKSAREEDANNQRMAAIIQGLNQMAVGSAAQQSGVYSKPMDVKVPVPNSSKGIQSDYQDQMKSLMDEYKLFKNDEMSPYQKRSLALREQGLENRELGLATRQAKEVRLSNKDKFNKEVKNRLSDKEVEGINAFDDGVRILDDIDALLTEGKVQSDLGPYASRLESAQQYIPGVEMDTPFVETQQLVGIQLADYVKSISGAQVSEEEAQRLLKNIPNMQDKPGAFKTKLDQFRTDLADAKVTYLENIGKQKKGAEKFLKDTDKAEAKAAKGSDPKIEKYAKQHGLDYKKAEQILKSRGYK